MLVGKRCAKLNSLRAPERISKNLGRQITLISISVHRDDQGVSPELKTLVLSATQFESTEQSLAVARSLKMSVLATELMAVPNACSQSWVTVVSSRFSDDMSDEVTIAQQRKEELAAMGPPS